MQQFEALGNQDELARPTPVGARLSAAALKRVLEDHRAWLSGSERGLRATLNGIVLAEAMIEKLNLERADLKSANFIDARMSGINLSGAVLQYADLGNATLVDADLSRADLMDAKLDFALLAAANLSEARLLRTSFRRANLRAARMLEAAMEESNFTGAVLKEACLNQARAVDCDFSEADFTAAQLYHALFRSCRMAGISAAGSACAMLPPTVPRLRIW